MDIDAVVVGAGHAGLAASQQLASAGIEHLVLERDVVGSSWRRQRWDTFVLNTPAWMNRLPGDEATDVGEPADGFLGAPVFADRLVTYVSRWGLPVREGVTVRRLEPQADGRLRLRTSGGLDGKLLARNVVVATGIQNRPVVPPMAASFPADVAQLHALEYRNAAALRPGAVLVVGCGQTGAQITDDLLDAGREVHLSPSRVGRVPRRYRGRDTVEWLDGAGFFDVPSEAVDDPAELTARQPLVSGVGRYGRSLSIQWLAARGATLIGRIRSVEGSTLVLDDSLAECIRFGDQLSVAVRDAIDDGLRQAGVDLPPLEDDPADMPHPDPDRVRSPERLDLARAGIGSVVWATGVRGDFSWLPETARDADGTPLRSGSRTPMPGLFVLGFPWLTHRGSGIVRGIAKDAALVAGQVLANLDGAVA